MQRILIIGCGGSGKTTLAKRLGERLQLPVIHLDAYYWQPGWQPTPVDAWEQTVSELIAGEGWVMDGNYGGTLHLRLPVCDTVIFMDLPWWRCLAGVLRRRLRSLRTPRLVAPGCPDRLTWEFLHYVIAYPIARRPQLLQRLDAYRAEKNVVVLRSRKAATTYVDTLYSSSTRLPDG